MTDWQVGDLAALVDDSPCPYYGKCPLTLNKAYRVEAIHIGFDGAERAVGLSLEGEPCEAPMGYHSNRFRKIRPDKHEECEPEFVTLLKRSKKRVSA